MADSRYDVELGPTPGRRGNNPADVAGAGQPARVREQGALIGFEVQTRL